MAGNDKEACCFREVEMADMGNGRFSGYKLACIACIDVNHVNPCQQHLLVCACLVSVARTRKQRRHSAAKTP